MMMKMDIADLVFDQDPDAFYKRIEQKLKQDGEYLKAQEIFDKHIGTLKGDLDYQNEVETSVVGMEAATKRVAFSEGFKAAIKLMMSVMD